MKEKLEQLNSQLVAGEKLVKERKADIKAVEKELAINKRDLTDETIINGQLNAKIGEVNFNYEIAVSHKDSTEKKLFKQLRQLKKDFKESKNRLKKLMFTSKVALKQEKMNFKKKFSKLKKGNVLFLVRLSSFKKLLIKLRFLLYLFLETYL